MIEFLDTIFRFRGILFYRTIASLRADARSMYLGYIWWLLEPMLNTAIYYFIFGYLLGNKTNDFIAYLLIGTVAYQWFQGAISSTMGSILNRAHLYRQIPLPKYIFGLVDVLSNTWKFLCVALILLISLISTKQLNLSWLILLLPFAVFLQLAVIVGFSIILAIGSAYIRDLNNFTSVIFRALMFLSGIFWDVSKVPEDLKVIFYMNPAASLIQIYRDLLIYDSFPSLSMVSYLLILALITIQVGIVWHRRIDAHILKHIQA